MTSNFLSNLNDNTIIAALIAASVTFLVSVISSVISLITNFKNRKVLEEVEILKTNLQKENISFQIKQSELAKLRFEKLDNLYNSLIDYIEFQKKKVGTDYNLTIEPHVLVQQSEELFLIAWSDFRKSKLYLTKDITNAIEVLLLNCKKATENYFRRERIEKDYAEYTEKLFKNIDKIEPLLAEIENKINMYLENDK